MGNLGPQSSHAIRSRQARQLRSNCREELLDRAFFTLTIDGGSRSPLRTSRMAARLRSSAASDTALGRRARDDRVESTEIRQCARKVRHLIVDRRRSRRPRRGPCRGQRVLAAVD